MGDAPDALQQAAEAHRKTRDAQQAMRDASKLRDAAVRAAFDAGHHPTEIGERLGISRNRVYAIIGTAN